MRLFELHARLFAQPHPAGRHGGPHDDPTPIRCRGRRDCAPPRAAPSRPPTSYPDRRAQAYAVQRSTKAGAGTRRRVGGRKIGLTSPAVQRQLGVDRPDFGRARQTWPAARRPWRSPRPALLASKPRSPFLLTHRPRPGVAADAVRAVAYAVAALEIVDSRIADWGISLPTPSPTTAPAVRSRRPGPAHAAPSPADALTMSVNARRWPAARAPRALATRRRPSPGSPTLRPRSTRFLAGHSCFPALLLASFVQPPSTRPQCHRARARST